MRTLILLTCLVAIAHTALAQCSVVAGPPLEGIGVLEVAPMGDTTLVRSLFQSHGQDKVFYFEKRGRGARSAAILLRRADGVVQGLYPYAGDVYFISANNVIDFKSRTGSYTASPIRTLWYLPTTEGNVADDEAWLFILAQHLDVAWPVRKQAAHTPTVQRRIYAQAPTPDEVRAACEAAAASICQDRKQLKATDQRLCDDGSMATGTLDFTCFADKRSNRARK